VPLTDRTAAVLGQQFAVAEAMPFSVRTAQRIVHRVADRARIAKPCSCHILRHTFAVLALMRGVSLKTLQLILGHSSLAVTERYLNLAPEEALREFWAKW
jgi:integrase/recombinase XerD